MINIFALCPVCTVAVGAGVGLSRWLGIDDTVTGLWIGGLIVSVSYWTIDWLDQKKIKFYGRKILVFIGYYLLTVGPLYWSEIIGHKFNKFWGVDKLMLGIVIGSIVFAISAILYGNLKFKNNNRAHFPFQKVVMTVAPLIVFSVIFYYLTK